MANAKKLKSGSWRVLVYDYTDTSQRRHYKSFTAPTKKEAEYLAAEYSLSDKTQTYEDLTLSEAYDRYINSKSAVLSPSTIAGYKRLKKNYFLFLMPVKLSKITQQIIQTAVNEMSAKHAPKTVRNAHGLLHSVLKAYLPRFECNTTLPQRVKPKYVIPTTAEINTLLSIANDRIRIPILLASTGGLRRSEIAALTAEDFSDFGVTINKAAVYDENNKVIIKTTKTVSGTRFVPLPKNVVKEARAWKHFGIRPANIDTLFSRMVAKANVPKTSFHKLRHYFASELHAQGIPDQYIAEIGGWKTIEMLHRIYQHTLRDKQKPMNKKIINIFDSNFSNATQNATRTNESSVSIG